jgi:ribosomal protein S18 acetylase RimI-like enzyme
MSNSYKNKPIVKIKGHLKKIYWKLIRRIQKQDLKNNNDIRNQKEIINDWDYVDYVSDCSNYNDCYCILKWGRKKCLNK